MATNENLIPIPGRLTSVAQEKHVAGADEIYDDDMQMTQAAINALVLQDTIKTTLTANPSLVFVGSSAIDIALTATSTISASSIVISKNGTTIKSDTNKTSVSYTDSITPSSAAVINYSAAFTVGGSTKNATAKVTSVYPISYGAQATYDASGLTALNEPKTSAKGTYSIALDSTPRQIYFKVPKTNVTQISKVELLSNNNYSPVNGAISSTLSDANYNVWVSTDKYNVTDAGNRSFVVNR